MVALIGKEIPMPNGMTLIIDERFRQVLEEGFTAEHDDLEKNGELYAAARCYFYQVHYKQHMVGANKPTLWPWSDETWKPRDDRSNLVRAGALYMAERDRLVRQGNMARAIDMHRSAKDIADCIDSLPQEQPA
jgi:hypothetical protein